MYKILDRILLKTYPPAESRIYEILAGEDFLQPSSQIIVRAGNLFAKQTLPIDIQDKSRYMWEADVFLRYALIKVEHLAETYNKSIKQNIYGQKEIELENTIIECLQAIMKVADKMRGDTKVVITPQSLVLNLHNLTKLCKTTGSLKLIFYLLQMKEYFELSFHESLNMDRFEDDLMQTNNFASVLEESVTDDGFGARLAPYHFQYLEYKFGERTVIVDFEKVEYNGNSYISLLKHLDDRSLSANPKKPSEFVSATIRLTIFHALKRGRDEAQYLAGLLETFDTPAFEYRCLKIKHRLAHDVNTCIERRIKQVDHESIRMLYSNQASKRYFYSELQKEHSWILGYSLTENKYFTNQYKDNLVRNTKFYMNVAMRYQQQLEYFQRYSLLIKKIFAMFHHILDHPELYDDFKFDSCLENINFTFNEGQCMELWMKLKSTPLHKNITRLLGSFISHVLSKTIEEYTGNNHDWKYQLWRDNKPFLLKLLKCNLREFNFVDSDTEVFKDLLATPEFKMQEKNWDLFVECFYNKQVLKDEIKRYLKENLYNENVKRNNTYTNKVFTLLEKMDCYVDIIEKFKAQRRKVNELRAKYAKNNSVLDRCLFENFEIMLNSILSKANRLGVKAPSQMITEEFRKYIDKLLAVSQDTFNFFEIETHAQNLQDILNTVFQIYKSCSGSSIVEVYKSIISSKRSLLEIAHEGKHSTAQIQDFLKIYAISRVISCSMNDYYDEEEQQTKQIEFDQSVYSKEMFSFIISTLAKLNFALIDDYINKVYKHGNSEEHKVHAMVEISSAFVQFDNIFNPTCSKNKGGLQNLRDFLYELYKLCTTNISIIAKQVCSSLAQFPKEKKNPSEILPAQGSDYQVWKGMMECFFEQLECGIKVGSKSYCFENDKLHRINRLMALVADKAKDQNKYFLVHHFFTLHQQHVVQSLQGWFEQVDSDVLLEQALNTVFETYKNSGFLNIFGSEQRMCNLKKKLERNIEQIQQKPANKEGTEEIPKMSSLEKFMTRIYENIHLVESSQVLAFVKQLKEAFPQLSENIFKEILIYLGENGHIDLGKKKKIQSSENIVFNINNFAEAFKTTRGKLNTVLIVQEKTKITMVDLFLKLLKDPLISQTGSCSQEIFKPLKDLSQQNLLQLYTLYRSKVERLITHPEPNISEGRFLIIVEMTLNIQAQLTINCPTAQFRPDRFMQRILSIYNTKNELGDISKYLILENTTPQTYYYNVRQTVIFLACQIAREKHFTLDVVNGKLDPECVSDALFGNIEHVLKELPAMHSKCGILENVVKDIFTNQNVEIPPFNYTWLVPCIVEPRKTFVQSNMYSAVINIVLMHPHILDGLIEEITIPRLVESVEHSESFILVIVEYISYKPSLFYTLIDETLKKFYNNSEQKDLRRPLLSILAYCIENMCNITSRRLHQKNLTYLPQFRSVSQHLIGLEPLSRKLFNRLHTYKFKSFLNSLACFEYRLQIFQTLGVYPGASVMSKTEMVNSTHLLQREPNPSLMVKKDIAVRKIDRVRQISSESFQTHQLNRKYFYWFIYKSNINFSRKAEEIMKTNFEGVEYENEGNENPEQNKNDNEKEKENEAVDAQNQELHSQQQQQDFVSQIVISNEVLQPILENPFIDPNIPENQDQNQNNNMVEIQQPIQAPNPDQNQPPTQIQNQDKNKNTPNYSTEFKNSINCYNNYSLPSEDLIFILDINEQIWMKCRDKEEYLRQKVLELYKKSRKELKKLIINSEYMMMNEEEYQPDLKSSQNFINTEIKNLFQLKFKEFYALKGSPVVKLMDLTEQARLIIEKNAMDEKELEDEDKEVDSDVEDEEEMVQAEQQDNNNDLQENQNQNQNKVEEEIKEGENAAQNEVEDEVVDKTVNQIEKEVVAEQIPSQQIMDETNQLKQNLEDIQHTNTQSHNHVEDKKDGNLQANECHLAQQQQNQPQPQDEFKPLSDLLNSLELHLNAPQLSDQLICYLAYEFFAICQTQNESQYQYSISSRNNYLKFTNFAMRIVADAFQKTGLFGDLFEISTQTQKCNEYVGKMKILNQLYPCLFIDTNSEEFTLATYNTANSQMVKELETVRFNPVRMFPMPENNIPLLQLLEHYRSYFDGDKRKLNALLEGYFSLLSSLMAPIEIVAKKQDTAPIEVVTQSIVNFGSRDPRFIQGLDSAIYNIQSIPFADDNMGILGGLVDVAIQATIQVTNFQIERMKYMVESGNSSFNKFNLLQRRDDGISNFRTGETFNTFIHTAIEKSWFDGKIFMQGYGQKIANVVRGILNYTELIIKNTKNKKLFELNMESVQKAVLSERIKNLREMCKNTKKKVRELLLFKNKTAEQQLLKVQLNAVDLMLLQFIKQHGSDAINKSKCIFSMAPQIVNHYDNELKAFLSKQLICESSNNRDIELVVDRQATIVSSFKELLNYDKKRIRGGEWTIKFEGEIGIDGGGLMSEYIQLFISEVEDTRNGLFDTTRDGFLVPSRFSSNIFNYQKIFRSVGIIIGKSISHNLLSKSLPLERYIIKLIYGQRVGTLEDLKYYDKQMHDNFVWMLENDVSDMDITFQFTEQRLGTIQNHQLVKDGKNIQLTNQNKQQYIDLYIYWVLIESIRVQLEELLTGIHEVCSSGELRTLFTLQQLQNQIHGGLEFDIELYKTQVDLKSCCLTTNEIVWLFQILTQMNKEQIGDFLVFVTGRKRLPWNKFEQFKISLSQKADTLPTANTCNFKLNIGYYGSKEIEKNKLFMAMYETQGFHNF